MNCYNVRNVEGVWNTNKIVHPEMKITHPQVIQDVDEFVCSWE